MTLAGRVALVTGVSRQAGIAIAVVDRLRALGATVFATGWRPHDDEMPWGSGPALDVDFDLHEHDLTDPDGPIALIDEVIATHGALDIVAAVHARSSSTDLIHTNATELDTCWAVNVRSVVLLAQQFARVHDPARAGGRMLWFTSGQALQPMPGEIAYAITKAALHQMTASMADTLIEHGVSANCINPGPVDTGWAPNDLHAEVRTMFPTRRWGVPNDVANLVAFLVSDEGAWIVGQVLNSEGGFRRS